MSELLPIHDERWFLLNAACDDSLNEAQSQEFVALLGADDTARRAFVEHIQLRTEIRFLYLTQKACDNGLAQIRATFSEPAPPIGLPVATTHSTPGNTFQSWSLAYLVTALLFGIAVWIGAYVRVSHLEKGNLVQPQAVAGTHIEVGRITALADCEWSKTGTEERGEGRGERGETQISKSPNPQIPVFQGDRFIIASGLMQISYSTGAQVILQGPCTYGIDSERSGYLAVGKLTARVETGGGGRGTGKVTSNSDIHNPKSPASRPQSHAPLFAVRTPTAVVTDLGTEFGVEVEKSGVTRSHVFQGSVEVRSSNSRRLTTSREPVKILHAGESVRVERGRKGVVTITRKQGQPGRFVRQIPNPKTILPPPASRPSSPTRMSPDAYAQYVLSLDPVAYYRMERTNLRDDKGRIGVFDSSPGGHHGIFISKDDSCMPYAPGRFGDALSIRGDSMNDLAVVHGIPNPPANRMTVAAWVLFHKDPKDNVIAFRCGNERDNKQDITAFGLSYSWKSVLHRWHHVAYVVDDAAGKTTVRSYHNGKYERSDPFNAAWLNLSGGVWCIGGADHDLTVENHFTLHNLQGRIDEFAIFHKALSPETIERLYRGGMPAAKGERSHE